MKHIRLLIILTIIVVASYFFIENKLKVSDNGIDYEIPSEIGVIDPAITIPDFSFFDVDGKRHFISEFKGKLLIINFWATWCKPCVKELPQLDKLPDIIGEDEIKVIAISIDSAIDVNKISKFIEKLELSHIKAYQDKELESYTKIKIFGIPTSIIVDKNLQAHYKISGYIDWSNLEIISFINNLL